MPKTFTPDAIVIGAGSAGSYFAWQLARAGLQVQVLEARRLEHLGRQIEIFHMDCERYATLGLPPPEPPELIHTELSGWSWSPDLSVHFPVNYPFYVMHLPSFLHRLHSYARAAGVEFCGEASVEALVLEGPRLIGVRGRQRGKRFESHARLIIDASGLAAAVRSRLPQGFGVESARVPPEDCLFVCLEFRDRIPRGFPTGSNSYVFHKAFWNRSWGEGAILGIGQPHSFDHAWAQHKGWREEYFGDPGRVLYHRQGVIPYHRSPLSLVGEGLMVIGDAANQNRPFSGEGVTSGLEAARLAAEVAAQALGQGEASCERLWPYNVRFFRGSGAKFAAGLAQLPAAAELSRRDVDFLFHKRILFSSADFEELNRHYEVRTGPGKLLRTGLLLGWGVLRGQFSRASLARFLDASGRAARLGRHYRNFPTSPAEHPPWAAEARALWGEAL